MRIHLWLVVFLAASCWIAGHAWRLERDAQREQTLVLKHAAAHRRIREITGALSKAQSAVQKAEIAHSAALAAQQEAEQLLRQEQATNDPLRRQLEQAAAEIIRVRAEAHLRDEQLRIERAERTRIISELRRELEQARIQIATLERERDQLMRERSALEEKANRLSAELENIRRNLAARDAEIAGLRREIQELKKDAERRLREESDRNEENITPMQTEPK